MKAIVQDRYGLPDVLHVADIEEPVAGADEVLVRVLAASAFIGDWHVVTGLPYAIRAVSGFRAPSLRSGSARSDSGFQIPAAGRATAG